MNENTNDWRGKLKRHLSENYIEKGWTSVTDEIIEALLNQHSARIVERIETLKVDGETPCGHQDLHETEVAYNQALDQVIDIVKDI
jgi:hypothetical protein